MKGLFQTFIEPTHEVMSAKIKGITKRHRSDPDHAFCGPATYGTLLVNVPRFCRKSDKDTFWIEILGCKIYLDLSHKEGVITFFPQIESIKNLKFIEL